MNTKILCIESHKELIVLFNGMLRKIYLFDTFFNKLRTEEGYSLNFESDVQNISSIYQHSQKIDKSQEKYFILKRIYKQLLFEKDNTLMQ